MIEKRNDDILACWKEIADYLERSVRTCQRWAKDKNLPVSYPAGEKTSPYASKSALDAWRLSGGVGEPSRRPGGPEAGFESGPEAEA